jgi:hypothetical protein
MADRSPNVGPFPAPVSVDHALTLFAAWPVADDALSQQILDILQQAGHYHQLKKGANEGKLCLCARYYSSEEYESRFPSRPANMRASSNQNSESWNVRDHNPRRRHLSSRHPPPSPPPMRRQKCPLCLRAKQDCSWTSMWSQQAGYCSKRDHK